MDRKDRELHNSRETAARSDLANAPEFSPSSPPSSLKSSPKSEELLRKGEELFTMGLVEQALHVWTRILFLDRGNVVARKAIERAKRTLSERQRQLDVEVVSATELLDRGLVAEAAEKIREVLAMDPRHREGHQVATEISALEARMEPPVEGNAGERAPEAAPSAPSKRGLLLRVSRASRFSARSGRRPTQKVSFAKTGVKMAGFVLGAILFFASGGLYLHLNWDSIVSDGAFGTSGVLATAAAPEIEVLVPSSSELRYYNAERLVAKGRHREALEELGRIDRNSAVFERARHLTLRVEARLLRGASEPQPETDVAPAPELDKTR